MTGNTASSKTFRSGVSGGLVGFLLFIDAVMVLPVVCIDFSWKAFLIPTVMIMVSIWFLFTIKYTTSGTRLIVKCAHITLSECDIMKITRITPTRTILSAPASSFDRLQIDMIKGSPLVVSPKDKEGFIQELRRINPEIACNRL